MGTQMGTGGADTGKESHSFLSDPTLGADGLSMQQPGLPLGGKKSNPCLKIYTSLELDETP